MVGKRSLFLSEVEGIVGPHARCHPLEAPGGDSFCFFFQGCTIALLFWPFYGTMDVSGSFSIVLVNPAPEKQFANLGRPRCPRTPLYTGRLKTRGLLGSFRNPPSFLIAGHADRQSTRLNSSHLR